MSTAPWITITAPNSGSGNGAISYSVAANTSTMARTSSLTIAGQTFKVMQTPPSPLLLIDETSGRAAALESVIFTRDPLPVINTLNFSLDRQTRVILFAVNAELNPGEDLSVFAAQAEDSQHVIHPLTVEFVGTVPNFNWLTQINVRLSNGLANAGNVWISISLRGVPSNQVLIGIRPSPPN